MCASYPHAKHRHAASAVFAAIQEVLEDCGEDDQAHLEGSLISGQSIGMFMCLWAALGQFGRLLVSSPRTAPKHTRHSRVFGIL